MASVAASAATPPTDGSAPDRGPDDVDSIQIVDITEEDDFGDAEARAELIAAAVAEASADTPSPGADGADGAPPDAPRPSPEAREADPRLRLPADALLALSAIHREGLASLPAEYVIDLGEATTEQERDRLLAAALAHAEMQDAKYRVPTESATARRWKAGVAGALLLVAVITAASPPSFVVPAPTTRFTAADGDRGARLALMLQAEQVEAFRVSEGRLPDTLDELPESVAGIRFVRSTNRVYQLVTRGPDGASIVYDSAAPEERLEELHVPWSEAGAQR
jgi:hypothetical protein